jgi:O-succinylbenzoate synthase
MNEQKQRNAIAEACGKVAVDSWGEHYPIPDYLNDLNAMHEAEEVLQRHMEKWWNYVSKLAVANSTLGLGGEAHATAAQRAEAFLKTLGLWEE